MAVVEWITFDISFYQPEILSDEPAMHEETMNAAAFAKKGLLGTVLSSSHILSLKRTLASPRKDKIPTLHSQRVFCRTCQTNQTLHLNLLSNYLPPEDDPNYQTLLAQLPQYQASLDVRYPLVCSDCAGNVDDEIKKSERLGRSAALGSWLQAGTSRRSLSPERLPVFVEGKELWAWRTRGLLWLGTLLSSIVGTSYGPYPLSPANVYLVLTVSLLISS